MARKRKEREGTPTDQMFRLEEKIAALGGTIPQPWPWAINKTWKSKGKIKMEVDLGLRNLQLLELLEDLQKKQASKMDTVIAAAPTLN